MQPISTVQSQFSQVEPFNGVLMSFVPSLVPSFGHESCHANTNPADVLRHLGVDSVFALARTALPPAHDPGDKVGIAVTRDVRTTAVALASVLGNVVVACAEHLLFDAQPGGFNADGPTHVGDCESLQGGGWLSSLAKAAKTTDHTVRLPHQDLQEAEYRSSSSSVFKQFSNLFEVMSQ